MARLYGEIPKARGVVVQVMRDSFRNRERLDLREWVEDRPGSPDSRQPTRKGVSIPLSKLPSLLAALRTAETDALQAGLLRSADYEAAGLTKPDIPRKAEAA